MESKISAKSRLSMNASPGRMGFEWQLTDTRSPVTNAALLRELVPPEETPQPAPTCACTHS
jgi:hypothetical protein